MASPRALLEWTAAACVAVLMVGAVFLLLMDAVEGDYPRLVTLYDIKTSAPERIFAWLVVAKSAIVATLVMLLFRSTRGNMAVEWGELKISAPVSQVTLWIATMAATAILIYWIGHQPTS